MGDPFSFSKAPPGTWVERDMYESKAFLSLRGFAPQLLVLVLAKRQFVTYERKVGKQKKVCTNCDKLNITYTEFDNKYGITQPRMTRAIGQLLEKGFLSRVYSGGTYRQDKAIFSLSEKWRLWSRGMVFETREMESVERGFCQTKNQKSHTKP
jgi:hypothetical protein